MNMPIVVGMLFVAGVILFFTLGYFLANRKKSVLLEETRIIINENKLLQNQINSTGQQLEKTNKSWKDTYIAYQNVHEAYTHLKEILQKAKKENEILYSQYTSLRKETGNLNNEKTDLTHKLKQIYSAMTKEKELLHGKIKELKKDISKDKHTKPKDSEKIQKELKTLEKENEELRSLNKEIETLKNKIKKLKSENAVLQEKRIVLDKSAESEKVSAIDEDGNIFNTIINNLSSVEGNHSTVLSDLSGIPVAGSGKHFESLAGTAGIFKTIDERIHSILSIGPLKKFTITDDNQLTVTTRPLSFIEGDLILTTLSKGSGPDDEKVKEAVKKAAPLPDKENA